MNILKKFFSFSIGSFGAAIIGFLSIPVITRMVSPSEYGLVSIFISIGLILSTIVLGGMDQALSRFYLQERLKSLFTKTFSLSIISFFIITILLIISQNYIHSYIGTDFNYVFYIICYLFAALMFRYSLVILRMKQLGYRYSGVYIGQRGLEFLLILFLLTFISKDHLQIITGTIFSLITFGFIGFIVILRSKPEKSSVQNFKDSNTKVSTLLKYGSPLMVATLIMSIFQNIDKLILNNFVDNYSLGVYSAALQIAFSMNVIQSAFASYWIPLSIERFERNPEDKEFFSKTSNYITVLMVSIAVFLISFRELIVFLLGDEYRSASSILPMLILMPVLMTMSETVVIGINFKMKSYLHIYIAVVSLMINVALLFLFVPLLGVHGASISIGSSYIVYYFLRDYFGNKSFSLNNNKKKKFIVIFSLYLYAFISTFTSNYLISVICSVFIFVLLFYFYSKEIKYASFIMIRNNNLKKGMKK